MFAVGASEVNWTDNLDGNCDHAVLVQGHGFIYLVLDVRC